MLGANELKMRHVHASKRLILLAESMLLLFLATCSVNRFSTLNDVDALGWESNRYLWASGHRVRGIGESVIARYDVQNGDVTWFDFGFEHLLVAQDASVWALNSYSVNRYRNGDWQEFDGSKELPAGPFWSMLEANDGSIWVGSSGLSRYDPADGNWDVIIPPLPKVCDIPNCPEPEWGAVYALLQDRKGAIWAGTSSGVMRLDDNSRESWTTQEGLTDNSVRALVEDKDGVIWAGTADGINWWDGNQWHASPDPNEPDHVPGSGVGIEQMVAARDGGIWATGQYTLLMWNGEGWNYVDFPCRGSDGIGTLMEASDGHMWVGTFGAGVCQWDGQDWQAYTMSQGLNGDRVYALLESPDALIWAGTDGMNCYDPAVDQWHPFSACLDR